MSSKVRDGRRRCEGCAAPAALCLCDVLPTVANRTRLVLILPVQEAAKSTNSGLIAARCLADSEIHIVGRIGQRVDYESLAPDDGLAFVLFPSSEAKTLDQDLIREIGRPSRLIVPDGHWKQAAKLRRKLPRSSRHIVDVMLPSQTPQPYVLRRAAASRPEGIATMPAIARALTILEGLEIGRPLEEAFAAFVARSLARRTNGVST